MSLKSNEIVQKIHKLYSSLGKSGKPKDGEEWTCLSAFVVEDASEFEVVSLATGTKCIGAGSMTTDGTVVFDSHAEVLARRNFLRYLYSQLEKTKSSSSIFEVKDGVYVLREGVKFHFYASQVPCGDASIIPMDSDIQVCKKRKTEPTDPTENTPSKKPKIVPDIHRTGAKPVLTDSRQDPKKDGADYHTRGAVRIKPGRGDPTKSLSCSDKITKWLFCGVQGALLSILIPTRLKLSTIIIGGCGPYDAKVIEDALVSRSGLEEPPEFIRSTKKFQHSPESTGSTRPCAASLNWSLVSDKQMEVSVEGRRLGVTKKSKNKSHLLISKFHLFQRFLHISSNEELKSKSYYSCKQLATSYQMQKKLFLSKMGSWSECKRAYDEFHYFSN